MHISNFVDTCLGTSRILQRRREQGDCCCHCRSCCCRCCRGEEPGAPRTLMMEESSKTLILMVIVWSSSQPGTRVWLGIQSVTGERRIGWLALNTITQGHRTQWVRGAAAMMKSQWINNCISLLQAFDMTVLDNVRYGTRYVHCAVHWFIDGIYLILFHHILVASHKYSAHRCNFVLFIWYTDEKRRSNANQLIKDDEEENNSTGQINVLHQKESKVCVSFEEKLFDSLWCSFLIRNTFQNYNYISSIQN